MIQSQYTKDLSSAGSE